MEFDFSGWVSTERFSGPVVKALMRENLTRPETLAVLARNEEDIKNLGLEVGDRIRLKAGLAHLKEVEAPTGETYGQIGDIVVRNKDENTDQDDYMIPKEARRGRRQSLGDKYMDALLWRRSSKPEIVTPAQTPDRSSQTYNKAWLAPPRVDRDEAQRILLQRGRNRAFLVRLSSSNVDGYTISMLVNGTVTHFPIEKRGPKRFFIGQHEYPDLTSIVTYYSRMPITRVGDYEICLGDPIVL